MTRARGEPNHLGRQSAFPSIRTPSAVAPRKVAVSPVAVFFTVTLPGPLTGSAPPGGCMSAGMA